MQSKDADSSRHNSSAHVYRSFHSKRMRADDPSLKPFSSGKKSRTSVTSRAAAAWVDLEQLDSGGGDADGNADVPLVSTSSGRCCGAVQLVPYRAYTIGRSSRHAEFTFSDPRVSKLHCQILFDASLRRLYILDGAFSSDSCSDSSCLVHEFRERVMNLRVEDEGKDRELRFSTRKVVFRASLNGVFVNGVRIGKGLAMELSAGDEIALVCTNSRGACGSRPRIGFIVRRIVFQEEVIQGCEDVSFKRPRLFGPLSTCKTAKRIFATNAGDSESFKSECDDPNGRAKNLSTCCRCILRSDDPVSYIQQWINPGSHGAKVRNSKENHIPGSCNDFKPPASGEPQVDTHMTCSRQQKPVCDCLPMDRTLETLGDAELCPVSTKIPYEDAGPLEAKGDYSSHRGAEVALEKLFETSNSELPKLNSLDGKKCPLLNNVGQNNSLHTVILPPGKSFYLNRLVNMEQSAFSKYKVVSLPELLYPVESITRMFIATFTSDILWFLSYCEIPTHLPITVACHNTERCWSSAVEKRTSVPFPNFPNLVVVYPPFPEAIAFGKDCNKKGIACHHPKLLVLQREESVRVIITSANLVSKQWNNVTNTVWWQDFPRLDSPDYSSLFTQIHEKEANEDSSVDFAAQLAGFVATLLTDVPSQANWITELTKYDFKGAMGYLIASVPGVHSYKARFVTEPTQLFLANQWESFSSHGRFLGSVEASVVGLSHLFRTKTDSKGAHLRKLAAFLGKSSEKVCGMSEVVLRRNKNVLADPNAVSVLIPNPNELSKGDCVQLGFLPRNVAKWVSPLWDIEFFRFSGYVLPKEAVKAAFGENNVKVQLILCVSQGSNFQDMSTMMQPKHAVALCSLIACLERSTGLWRLQEVLNRYKWPESLESDFIYGASSVGSSVCPQFLSTFSSAAGKRSSQSFDSEESDPEWGCWSVSHELKNPSMRLIFPTIDRVKNACDGILPSKYILCFAERTWQRLKALHMIHDAVPHPSGRVGHPMHVKVARRRFKPKADGSSFGWVYCGSHNLSAAAWGRPISSKSGAYATTSRLHVCNYELGIIFIFPEPEPKSSIKKGLLSCLDDVALPFVVPAPKYGPRDRPATKQAMREALAELTNRQKETPADEGTAIEEAMEEEIILDEEEEVMEEAQYVVQEKEEENATFVSFCFPLSSPLEYLQGECAVHQNAAGREGLGKAASMAFPILTVKNYVSSSSMSSLVYPGPPATTPNPNPINQQKLHSPLSVWSLSFMFPPLSITPSQSSDQIRSETDLTHRSLRFKPKSEAACAGRDTIMLPTIEEDEEWPGFAERRSRLQVQQFVERIRQLPPQERLDFVGLVEENDVGLKRRVGDFNDLLLASVLADEPGLALKLFEKMPACGLVPDGWTYSIMIRCYCKKGDPDEARRVAYLMSGNGFRPSVVTLTILVSSFCKKGRMKMAFEVVETMGRVGSKPNIRTYNWLLKGLCYVGRVEEAYGMLMKMIKENTDTPDIYSYTAVMDGFCKVGRSDEAFELLDQASQMGLTPNAATYNTLLNGYCKEGKPSKGLRLMKQMKESGCVPDPITYTTLLHGLLKWGEVIPAFEVFKEMMGLRLVVDERMMNTLLRGICKKYRTKEALFNESYLIFEKMKIWGHTIYPNTYCRVLHALSKMERIGHFPRMITVNRIVQALCEDGRMGEALSILVLVHETGNILSIISYSLLIHGFIARGDLLGACSVYGAALKQGIVPHRKPFASSS
ncbi:hypothetical protein Dimus_034813 [Dionaea muscipula]